MTLYDEFAVFCNEVGELLPAEITRENDDETNTLEFCRLLYRLLLRRNDTPCVKYPNSVVDIQNTYSRLVRQWYVKKRKDEEEDPVTLTFRWEKKGREKIFNIACSFMDAMVLTDILGAAEDYETRLERVRKWIIDAGKAVPKNVDVLQIITDNQVLNVTL